MGLHNDGGGSGNTVFLTPINTNKGTQWAQRVSSDTEGAVLRDANCGPVYELYHDSVSGFIESVRIVDKGDYGEELEIGLRDDEEGSELLFILQTTYSGSLGQNIIVKLEEIDPELPVKIGVFTKDKKRYSPMYQRALDGDKFDIKLENKYTKDGPKDLPAPEEKKSRGKVTLVWDERNDFLYELAKEVSIKNGWASDDEEFMQSSFVRAVSDEQQSPDEERHDDDDVPF